MKHEIATVSLCAMLRDKLRGASVAHNRMGQFEPPNAQHGSGWRFVEFAANPAPVRRVRASLTQSGRNKTSVLRAVSHIRGGGVRQIAVGVSDLRATARQLQAQGVVYGPEASGAEFLQPYGAPLEDLLHFEFTQRIGGYNRYGAANAPFRLPAMSALREH